MFYILLVNAWCHELPILACCPEIDDRRGVRSDDILHFLAEERIFLEDMVVVIDGGIDTRFDRFEHLLDDEVIGFGDQMRVIAPLALLVLLADSLVPRTATISSALPC